MNWIVTKYKGEWAIYDKESKAYVLFGSKKIMTERAKELNSTDVKKHGKGTTINSSVKEGDILYANTGVAVKVLKYDSKFGGRILVERADGIEGGKPMWKPLDKFSETNPIGKKEKGGSLTESFFKFSPKNYKKLLDSGKFMALEQEGGLMRIKEADSSKTLGKFSKDQNVLYIFGEKNLSNPLVVWLKENSFVPSSQIEKLAKGGEITIKDVDEWDVVNDWATESEKHPKYNVSYAQIINDINDIGAINDLDDLESYKKEWKDRYNLKSTDNESIKRLADDLWIDVLESARKDNAFENYVKILNKEREKRLLDISENYIFIRHDRNSGGGYYIFKHKVTNKEIKLPDWRITEMGGVGGTDLGYVSREDALKTHFQNKFSKGGNMPKSFEYSIGGL